MQDGAFHKQQEADLEVTAGANDGVLDVAALLHNHIVHHNGAHNLDIVAQLAGGADDRALDAALVTQHAALANNAAC